MPAMKSTRSAKRDLVVAAGIWVVLTIVGEIIAVTFSLHPPGASREARITDDAFDLLLYLAVPVFTFVLVVGGFSIARHRAGSGPDRDLDGPPIRSNKLFIGAWVTITSVLSVIVIITPGFTGLDELRAEPMPELIIDVQGERWNWTFTYAETGVETQGALMLPVDTRILFRITSVDVIHSFWIPAFRIKQDAVPGKVTTTMVTAEELGTFTDQTGLRVQCAEMCGVGHARMWTEVTVLTADEFADWLHGAGG